MNHQMNGTAAELDQLTAVTTSPSWVSRDMCRAQHNRASTWGSTNPSCVLDPGHAGRHATCFGFFWNEVSTCSV